MNKKKSISLTICWILLVVSGLCALLFANNKSAIDTEAEQHFEKANELRKVSNYDAAITEYKKVVSLSPNSEVAQNAQYWIGQIYVEMGQFDTALSAFQKLLDEHPKNPNIETIKIMIERVKQSKKNKSLFKAVEKGDIEQVKSLISEGADVNGGSIFDDWTPLQQAVEADSLKIAEFLINKGADLKDTLYYAIWNKNKEMVELLLRKGADVNAIRGGDKHGWTPLFHAVFMENLDTIRHLVDNGAKFDVKDKYDLTALQRSVLTGRRDVVKLFISKGADDSSLQMAAFMGELSHVKDLVEKGIDINVKDDLGWTALRCAAFGYQTEVFKYLIENGADVSTCDSTGQPLLYWLVNHMNSKFYQNRSHIYMEMIRLLVDNGADVNAKDKQGRTPLHSAAYGGNKDVLELLIAHNADVDAKDNGGVTPLGLAVEGGHSETAELLRKYGAKISVGIGQTPLHDAVRFNDTVKLKSLIADGVDVNVKNSYGRSPLHLVCMAGRKVKQAELLITAGADINAKDKNGHTPLWHAQDRGHAKLVELLRKHGAKE